MKSLFQALLKERNHQKKFSLYPFNFTLSLGMKYTYDDEGYNPLHVAGKFGKWKVVKVLVQRGAVIDPPGIKDGMTPLQLAVR